MYMYIGGKGTRMGEWERACFVVGGREEREREKKGKGKGKGKECFARGGTIRVGSGLGQGWGNEKRGRDWRTKKGKEALLLEGD